MRTEHIAAGLILAIIIIVILIALVAGLLPDVLGVVKEVK